MRAWGPPGQLRGSPWWFQGPTQSCKIHPPQSNAVQPYVNAFQAPGSVGLVKPMKGHSAVCLLGEGRFKQRDGAAAEGGGLRT